MTRILPIIALFGLGGVVALAVSPEEVRAQEDCEWCQVDFCGGTNPCDYDCESSGMFELQGCEGGTNGCDGRTCLAEEQQLPDQTPLALLRDCDRFSETNGVVADIWRGVYEGVSLASMPAEPATLKGWGG